MAFDSRLTAITPHKMVHKVLIPVNAEVPDLPDHVAEFKQFQKDFEVIRQPFLETIGEWEEAFKGDLKDIGAFWVTNVFFGSSIKFNELIDLFPESVRVVVIPWVGHDNLDGPKLRAKGIILANVGDAPSKDVADIALSLTLSTFRYTSYFEGALRKKGGNITEVRSVLGGTDVDPETREPLAPTDPKRKQWTKYVSVGGKDLNSPAGKVAGIVGLGSIGKEIALRLWAIGLKIAYTKRTPLSEEESRGFPYQPIYYESLEELAPHVDLLVLAVPHSPATVKLINEDSIKLFKKGVRIVNIGRGSVIDEDVLFKALDDGTVNSVGLDVFLNEPQIDKRFLNRADVAILPHLGSFTLDNFKDAVIRSIENIEDVLLHDGPALHPVN